MKRALLISILLSVALPMQPALPGDGAQGKKLHDANCAGCHDTGVYTRPNRKIKSLAALNEQLAACSHAGPVTLTDDEQESVVRYLNEQFYKFK
jgi:mono/diheme cytochrome c family protein